MNDEAFNRFIRLTFYIAGILATIKVWFPELWELIFKSGGVSQ